jgi:hypothetical protein
VVSTSGEVPGSSLGLRPIILTGLKRFPQSLSINTGTAPRVKPRPFPSASFPIHYSLIILSVDAI